MRLISLWALLSAGAACAQTSVPPPALPGVDTLSRLEALKQVVADQTRQLHELRRALTEQEASVASTRRALESELRAASGGGPAGAAPQPVAAAQTTAASFEPPTATSALPKVAPLFEQPGVLTPAGQYVLEPSMQYSYSSSNRIALVGYTVIPAILVGLIDVREVKRSTFTAALTLRHGLTNRLEVEAKLPYVYRSDTSIGREVLQGASSDAAVFDASGRGLGDAEFTARYQLNDGGADNPYYVASLRFKARTGKDPFEIPVATEVVGFRGDGVQRELPTGSGFYGLQPGITVLYPSDPVVFFGGASYLHSFTRHNVVRPTDKGPERLGDISPGGIIGFNFGMGLALNEKSSFSIGYDHSYVGKTRQNGRTVADSVPLQLGTLLMGYSYRLSEQRSINLSLGAGLTRDTPDVALTLRVPTTF